MDTAILIVQMEFVTVDANIACCCRIVVARLGPVRCPVRCLARRAIVVGISNTAELVQNRGVTGAYVGRTTVAASCLVPGVERNRIGNCAVVIRIGLEIKSRAGGGREQARVAV